MVSPIHLVAEGVLPRINKWLTETQVLSGLAGVLLTGLVAWLYGLIRQRRRFGWNVLYDEPINQGDPSAVTGSAGC